MTQRILVRVSGLLHIFSQDRAGGLRSIGENARDVSLLDALDQLPSTTGNKSTLNPGSTVQSFAAFQMEVEIASSSEIYSPGASERVEIQCRSYKMRQGANER